MRLTQLATALAATLLVNLPIFAVEADEAVGLVTRVNGQISPSIDAFEEVHAGSSLVLTGASIEFLHYPSCESITVKGGKLFFSAQSYNSRDGLVTREKRRCPRTLRLKGDARVAGVVMRAGLTKLSMAAKPSLVLTGANRKKVTGLRFSLGGQLLLAARVEGPHFDWPEGKAALKANITYHVELMDLQTVVRKIPFKVERNGRTPTVIIAID
jgi:hypothetical protein